MELAADVWCSVAQPRVENRSRRRQEEKALATACLSGNS